MVTESTASAGSLGYAQSPEVSSKLTDWTNEPTLQQLKYDLENARQPQGAQMAKVRRWSDLLKVEGSAKPKKIKGRSSVQPKLIRRQAEWRYSALTEPFLGSNKLFSVKPVTFEDTDSARQNELVLNYQFRTKLNRIKFIDDYVRATVDEGTCIVRVGWIRQTAKIQTEVPVWEHQLPTSQEQLQPLQEALALQQDDPRTYNEKTDPAVKAAVDYWHESGQATVAVQKGTNKVETEKVLVNHPTAEVMNPNNVFIDPACNGDIDKAMFIVASFETTKADLLKEGKRYKNLDKIDWSGNSPLTQPDHVSTSPDQQTHDAIRRKVVAYEYWGFYDTTGTGALVPIVVTWIGLTIIRMEINPYPDQKLPFVIVPYLPVKRELYGEPDAELLDDQQAVAGAVTRGMIDLMGRSANGQQGFAKGMLDPLNRRRFDNGQDYEFNPNMPPQNGHIEHKYPDIPQSAMLMLNLQNQEAESLTGVKSFSGGMSGDSYGDVAKGIQGVLDASAKREMAILRRLAKGMSEIGNKIIAMNGEFLSDEETIRITNEAPAESSQAPKGQDQGQFVKIKREDLQGDFDLEVDISTAEIDNAKAQDLAFMLQTVGPNEDPEMRRLILAEIADLKRMPMLAHKIRTFQPKPDPAAEKAKELQLTKLQKEVEKLQSEVELNQAKTKQAGAVAGKTQLDAVEQETGTTHEREKELMRSQAEGNQNLAVTKALLQPRKPDQSKPDIEAAVGFNDISHRLPKKDLGADPVLPVDSPVPADEFAQGQPQLPFGSTAPDQGMAPPNPAVA